MDGLSQAAQAAMYPQWAHVIMTIVYGMLGLLFSFLAVAMIKTYWKDDLRYYDDLKDDFIGLGFNAAFCILGISFLIATPRHMLGTPSWWPISASVPLVGAHAGTIERHGVLVALDARDKKRADELVAECVKMKKALTAYASSGIVDDALMSAITRPMHTLFSAVIRRAEYAPHSYAFRSNRETSAFVPSEGIGGTNSSILFRALGTMTPIIGEDGAMVLVQKDGVATRIYLPGREAIRALIEECRTPLQTLLRRNSDGRYPPTHTAKVVPELAADLIGVAEAVSLDDLSAVDQIMAEIAYQEFAVRTINVQGYPPNEKSGILFAERLSFTDDPKTVYRFPAAVALEVVRWTQQWNDIALGSEFREIPDDPARLAMLRDILWLDE